MNLGFCLSGVAQLLFVGGWGFPRGLGISPGILSQRIMQDGFKQVAVSMQDDARDENVTRIG